MQIKLSLIEQEHLSEILFLLGHHRSSQIVGIFATERQKQFYDFAILNMKYENIKCQTYRSLREDNSLVNGKIVVIMDIPYNFETLKQIFQGCKNGEQVILILMKENRKYINMLNKRIGQGYKIIITSDYSKNKLVGINNKLRDLVDKSYDMNRAAFYAYGAYLNNFRQNLLKFIFKTQDIDVAALAKSFGFTTPPRVKEGKFLKVSVRKQKVLKKKVEKKMVKKQGVDERQEKQEENVLRKSKAKKLSIKEIAQIKTKKILKNKMVVLKSKPKSKLVKKAK